MNLRSELTSSFKKRELDQNSINQIESEYNSVSESDTLDKNINREKYQEVISNISKNRENNL